MLQIVAYFTTEDEIETDNFIRTIVAWTEGFDELKAQELFVSLFGDVPRVSLADCLRHLRSDVYPEVVDGLVLHLSAYCSAPDSISRDDFTCLQADFYAANPGVFHALTAELWR